MKREKWIQVRVSDIEKGVAEDLAASHGRTLSSYVRWLLSLAVDQKIILKDSARSN